MLSAVDCGDHCNTLTYCVVLCSIVLYSVVLCCVVLYYTVQCVCVSMLCNECLLQNASHIVILNVISYYIMSTVQLCLLFY